MQTGFPLARSEINKKVSDNCFVFSFQNNASDCFRNQELALQKILEL